MRSGTRLLRRTPKVRTRKSVPVLSQRSQVRGGLLGCVGKRPRYWSKVRRCWLGDEERNRGQGSEHRGAVWHFSGSIPALFAEQKRGDHAVQDEP